jgi:RpiB/LacA/LacB family sugar-phosphate isomerase
MKIAFACDHGGFSLRDAIIKSIEETGNEVIDFGINVCIPVDYPDYVEKVSASILSGQAERGIVVCGSGVGACIAANKFKGIYAAVCHDTYSAHQGVEHDQMNVLCLGGRIIGVEVACEIVIAFVNASFTGVERHIRRVNKIKEIERRG